MIAYTRVGLIAFLFATLPVVAHAQEPVAPGALMMVKEGVFELRHGKSIDITDRKILLTFPVNQSVDRETGELRGGRFMLMINGDSQYAQGGTRFDLRSMQATKRFVEDFDVCLLDVVELIQAKGSAPRAVMRVNCQ
jgi:hypothetical protein